MVLFSTFVVLVLIKLNGLTGDEVVKNFTSEESYTDGDTAVMICQTDSSWEYCQWSHQTRDQTRDRTRVQTRDQTRVQSCKLEWKRAQVFTKCAGHVINRQSSKVVDVFMEITHNLPSPHKVMDPGN